MKSLRLIALLVLLGCSHDAKRENPLDPELTPPVTLTAVADDSTGTVRLSWSTAEGQFAEYLVLRNRFRQTDVDTVARLAQRTA